MSTYRIKLEPDDNGTVLITAPDFPELTSFAEGPELAESVARGAIEEAIAARISRGDDVPAQAYAEPKGDDERVVIMPILTSLKVDLYNAMKAEGVTKAELGRRLGQHPPQIDRLLKLDHASQPEAIAEALGVLQRGVYLDGLRKGQRRPMPQVLKRHLDWCRNERDVHARAIEMFRRGEMHTGSQVLGGPMRETTAESLAQSERIVADMDRMIAELEAEYDVPADANAA